MDPLGLAVIVAVLLAATTFGLWRRRTDGIIRDESESEYKDEAADKEARAEILAAAGLEPVELPDQSSPTAAATAAAKAASTAAAKAASTAAAKAASTAAAVALQGTHAGHPPVRPLAADEPGTVVPDRDEEPGVVENSAADPSAAGARLAPGLLERLGIGPAEVTLLQFSSAFCAPCRAVRRVSAEVAELLPGAQHVEIDAESHLDEVRELGIWRTPTLLVLDREGRVAKRATGVPSKPQLIAAIGELLPPAD